MINNQKKYFLIIFNYFLKHHTIIFKNYFQNQLSNRT